MKIVDLIYGPNHRQDRRDRRAARYLGVRCPTCERLVGDKHTIKCPSPYERVDVVDAVPHADNQ